jgi:16S rRNA processing protein RimM
MRAPPQLILIGRVAGAFGVKGELRLTAYTGEPDALLRYGPLLRENGDVALTLTGGRAEKGALIARAAEIATREEAQALRGLALHVPRAAFPEPEGEDEFYLADLIGLAAVTPAGEVLGVVRSVQNFGAGDLIEIEPAAGGPTFWVPFTREAVPMVGLTEGQIVIASLPD